MRILLISASALVVAACGGNKALDDVPVPESDPNHLTFDQPVTVFSAEKIYTGNSEAPAASGIVVDESGQIIDLLPEGFDGDITSTGGSMSMVEVPGIIYPGFVDGHAHLLGIGLRELTFDLEGTASVEELNARIESALENHPEGTPLYGRGWIETGWEVGRMPVAADIDAISPNTPIVLERADGHAVLANSAAMVAAGITDSTPDPDGGKIERDADGAATGILIDKASALVMPLIQKPSEADVTKAYEVGAKLYASRGWTGLHNMSAPPQHAELLAQLDAEGKLPIRIYNAFDLGEDNQGMEIAATRAHETDTITNRAVKIYMDGALGSRGAQLIEPYSDRPDTIGLSLTSTRELRGLMMEARALNVQLAMHAIGDLANRKVLMSYNAAKHKPRQRWRVEHAQIIAVEDIAEFAHSGLIASMQPSHAIGDLHFAPARLGKSRLQGAYAWRSILDAGGIIVGGSDAPVEVGSPLIEFYAAVARKDLKGFSADGWHPEQAVTREEALTMFTSAPAFASFQESELGTIEIGKIADFTAFDRDLMIVPDVDILDAKVLMTVVGGDVVYEP